MSEPIPVLTEHELDCIQKIGRDEKNNCTTIGLPELDALIASHRELQRRVLLAMSPKVLEGNFKPGELGLTFPFDLFASLMGECLADVLEKTKAENYVECKLEWKVKDPTNRFQGPMTCTVQRFDGKTPHELRKQAVDKLKALRFLISQMLARAYSKRAGYPEKYCGVLTALAHERWTADLEELLTFLKKD